MGYFQEYIRRWKTGQTRVPGKKDPNLRVRRVEDSAGFPSTQLSPVPPGERHVPIPFSSGVAVRRAVASEMQMEWGMSLPGGSTEDPGCAHVLSAPAEVATGARVDMMTSEDSDALLV